MQFTFIGGAPKTGTSSLFYWLEKHPDINPSSPKETFFFLDQDSPLINQKRNIHNFEWDFFIQNFTENKPGITLEGTTHLLFQEHLPGLFSKVDNIQIKVIFILRDPVKRLLSSFYYTKNNLLRIDQKVSVNNYIEALRDPEKADWNSLINDPISRHVLKNDLDYGRYSNYLKRWQDQIGNENIHVIPFSDLKDRQKETMISTCDFLGIDSSFYNEFNFEKENESINVKYRGLYKIGQKAFKKIPAAKIKSVVKKMLSSSAKPSETLSTENQEFLLDFYKNEINELEKLGIASKKFNWSLQP
jgi:hypothetical protein